MGTMGRRDAMERITEAQLDSALSTISKPSTPQLSKKEKVELLSGISAAITSYPGQDVSGSVPGWLQSFERLAVKYSASEVAEAIRELLITPGQAFFPRPDEVAGEIVRRREIGAERFRTRKSNAPPVHEWKVESDEWQDEWKREMEAKAAACGMTFEEFRDNKFLPRKATGRAV